MILELVKGARGPQSLNVVAGFFIPAVVVAIVLGWAVTGLRGGEARWAIPATVGVIAGAVLVVLALKPSVAAFRVFAWGVPVVFALQFPVFGLIALSPPTAAGVEHIAPLIATNMAAFALYFYGFIGLPDHYPLVWSALRVGRLAPDLDIRLASGEVFSPRRPLGRTLVVLDEAMERSLDGNHPGWTALAEAGVAVVYVRGRWTLSKERPFLPGWVQTATDAQGKLSSAWRTLLGFRGMAWLVHGRGPLVRLVARNPSALLVGSDGRVLQASHGWTKAGPAVWASWVTR